MPMRCRRGGVSTVVAFALPVLIGLSAFAIDLGAVFMRSRQLQGIADAAALAAATDPARAQPLAEQTVAQAGWGSPITVTATVGGYAPASPIAERFTAARGADAVRVSVSADTPVFFGIVLTGSDSMRVVRSATAARARLASFSVGSRLASVQGGVANAILSALTGSSVSLSVADQNALAGADVELFAVADALRTRLRLTGASYDEVLAAEVSNRQLLGAIADVLSADGRGAAAGALRTLAASANGDTIALDRLIDFGALGPRDARPNGVAARVGVNSLLGALLGGAASGRLIAADLGGGVPGIASTRAWIAIGERPVGSPWLTVTDSGQPVIRTAQARIHIESMIDVAGVARVRLPLLIELAEAEARLDGIECGTIASRAVTIGVRPAPGTLHVAEVDRDALNAFGSDPTRGRATIATLPMVRVTASNRIALGGAGGWQQLRFSQAEVDAGATKRVSSSDAAQSVASSLVRTMSLRAEAAGLIPIDAGVVTAAIGAQLALVAPALDGVIAQLATLAGARIGEADVRVTGLRCGQPVLVA